MSKPRICNVCRKTFSSRQSLWKHKQKCCQSNIDNNMKPSKEQMYDNKLQRDEDQIKTYSGDYTTETPNLVDRVGGYTLNPSTQYESTMDINDGSSVDTTDNDGSSSGVDEISNYALSETVIRKHCIWLPSNTRAIIVGKSGCGKTTLLSHFCAQMS